MLVEKNDARVTRVGRFLRLGFDELPQLWNVLIGQMSLIGPRPDLPHALDLYQGDEALRLSVRPGLTGLAQVSGRTDIPWRERLAYDVQYVRNYSLGLDLRIALLTLVEFIPPLRQNLNKA
jgi:lipopolysaccharide/colanic/teichoic acid biosynthesis glycosyltransferase